jgi:hypothetical protein
MDAQGGFCEAIFDVAIEFLGAQRWKKCGNVYRSAK